MTRAQAVKHIKESTGRAYMLGVPVQAPVVGGPGKVFPLYACITITRAQALQVVESVLEGRFEKEALIRIRTSRHSMFIG